MEEQKEFVKRQIETTSVKMKNMASRTKSKMTDLMKDFNIKRKNINEDHEKQIEELNHQLKELKLEKSSWKMDVSKVLADLRMMTFNLVEGIVIRRRLATFRNKPISKDQVSHSGNGIVQCEECYGELGDAELYSFKSKAIFNF